MSFKVCLKEFSRIDPKRDVIWVTFEGELKDYSDELGSSYEFPKSVLAQIDGRVNDLDYRDQIHKVEWRHSESLSVYVFGASSCDVFYVADIVAMACTQLVDEYFSPKSKALSAAS